MSNSKSHRESHRDPPPLPDDATLTSGSVANDSEAQVEGDAIKELRKNTELPFRLRFPLDARIGKGGMGEVFRAGDRILQRDVAIKLLTAGRENTVAFHRFIRESQITAQLAHPNIVPIHGLEVSEQGRPALVMKCVEGVTFKQYIEECRNALTEPTGDPVRHSRRTRIEHFLRVCDAVDYAHHRSVIHRDLKPANLMLGSHHEVYVMDWGIARVLGEQELEAPAAQRVTDASGLTTGAGAVVGTPMYLAPEQSGESNDLVGPAADQYALGLCLQELMTLTSPREGKTAIDLLAAAQSGERAPVVARQGERPIPAGLRAIIQRATARVVADRYSSVHKFAKDLRHWQANEELSAFPDNLPRRAWRSIQHNPVWAMTAVLLLLAIAAATTTYSLIGKVRAQERAAAQATKFTGLVSKISGHMLIAEERASGVRVALESIAVEIEGRLRRPSTNTRLARPADLTGPDVQLEKRYSQEISFLRPIAVRAPDANAKACDAIEGRMKDIDVAFRALFLRPLGTRPGTLTPIQEAALIRDNSNIQYAYIGFEAGLLVNYPGTAVYPKGYDPRPRSWYRRARTLPAKPTFGRPFADAFGSGDLVPCNRVIHGPDGQVVGVAGIDISLDIALALLMFPVEYPVQSTMLIDSELRIVNSSNDSDRGAGIGLHDNKSKRTEPFEVDAVATRLRNREVNGVEVVGDSLYLFCRFQALGWYLVVQFRTDDVLG